MLIPNTLIAPPLAAPGKLKEKAESGETRELSTSPHWIRLTFSQPEKAVQRFKKFWSCLICNCNMYDDILYCLCVCVFD